ncbi:MAG: hypothetical protein WC789_06740 [Lentisphaeria bacterium]
MKIPGWWARLWSRELPRKRVMAIAYQRVPGRPGVLVVHVTTEWLDWLTRYLADRGVHVEVSEWQTGKVRAGSITVCLEGRAEEVK